MIKFIHAADIHLDSPLRGLERYDGAPVDVIRGATRRTFVRMVDLALAEQVAFVIIAGDLFDGDWKDYGTGLFFAAQMTRLRDHDVRVIVAKGNHDAASVVSKSLALPPNVHVFGVHPESVRLDALGVVLHGQSFRTRNVSENLALGYPPPSRDLFDIGVLHTNLDGQPEHDNYAPCTRDELAARGYRYWALGHVHQRQVIDTGAGHIVYPGNLQGRHARECGPKGCTLVTLDGGRAVDLRHEDLDVVRWSNVSIDVTGADAPEDVLERVEQRLAELDDSGALHAVRVEVVGATHAHRALHAEPERWTAECRARAALCGTDRVWLEKVRFRTLPVRRAGLDAELLNLLGPTADEPAPEDLAAFRSELAEFRVKVLRHLDGADDLDLNDDAVLAELLKEGSELLAARAAEAGVTE